ncbi:zinc ABC transporter substrate-binding protein [Aurantimonas sp. VKM B-3413]|nr:zinc ABC transporter substrate-binding protein [Aurantimonas sp. VKM B-3413]MCB8838985.1 zinc ABC transporter substrate-binding protein [Aurantimonas sp. VKM B-3413]
MRFQGLAALALLATTANAAEAAPKVVVSIKPIHSLVASVMQGVGEPMLIVDGAGSPHDYSLKPSQAAALQAADLVFWMGPELETFLAGPIKTIAASASAEKLDTAPGLVKLKPRSGGLFEADDDGDSDVPVDPHLWLDPENAKAMASDIATALAKADPENSEHYADNLARLNERLDALVDTTKRELQPIADKPFIVFHDAYQYFDKRFGLNTIGAITISPETAPGAARVAEIRDKIATAGAVCVFSEPEFEPKIVQVVTEGTDAGTGVLDPLGAELAAGPDLYFELISDMSKSLTACLGS